MDQVPLGNKAPRPGCARQIWCPACKGLLENPVALTSGHVLLECMVVEGTHEKVLWPSFHFLLKLSRYTNPWRNQSFPGEVFLGWQKWKICSLFVRPGVGCRGVEDTSDRAPAEGCMPVKTHWHVVEHVGRRGGECGIDLNVNCKCQMCIKIFASETVRLHFSYFAEIFTRALFDSKITRVRNFASPSWPGTTNHLAVTHMFEMWWISFGLNLLKTKP